MSPETLRLVVGGLVLVHGIAHVGAIAALLWIRSGHPTGAGTWSAAQSWLLPHLTPDAASGIATTFWSASLVGFALAALAFWGIALPVEAWPPIGLVSAVVSTTGIVVFLGTWPALNTVAALAVNVAVIVAVLAGWPPAPVLGA